MRLLTTLAFSLLTLTSMAQNPAAFRGAYPPTATGNAVDTFFGAAVPDPYRWLEDDRSTATAEWVTQQNKATQGYLSGIPYRQDIVDRLTQLWNYERLSAPFTEGDYTYFYKNDGLQNQSVLYRRKGAAGQPEVFLDPNLFSAAGTTSLAGLSFSPDGSLAAYQISEGGSDWRKVIVLEAATKKQLGDTLMNVKFSGLSWRANDGFYYSSYDKPLNASDLSAKTQNHKLFYHRLGTAQSTDRLIFGGEMQPRRYIGGGVSEDGQYLIVSAANATSGNELYIQRLSNKSGSLHAHFTGFDQEYDFIDSDGDMIYLLTNDGAPNRKLVAVRWNEAGDKSGWKTIIPEGGFPLSVSTGGGKLFAQYIKDAVSEVKQYDRRGKLERTIRLPGAGSAGGFGGKRKEGVVYYSFTSYTSPAAIYKYTIATGRSELHQKPKLAVNTDDFESKQIFYASKDGTRVPMIVTYKKGTKLDGTAPLLLYGYGGFNVSLTPAFSPSNIVFMEQGGIYAVPNLRGGGEYGDAWHHAGTKMKKQNVFDDFIAAAEYLIANKYTGKDRLAISGGSNGGLLVGACLTQRPDLFRVALPAVGVLDMLRYHRFTAGAGWAFDYGTADDSQEMFDYLLRYSPVHNARPGACYPATLITTADHDDRVVPAHSFKFAAALQAAQGCDRPVLARIDVNAGHGAGKSTSMIIAERADVWAFLFWNTGVKYTSIKSFPNGGVQPKKKGVK